MARGAGTAVAPVEIATSRGPARAHLIRSVEDSRSDLFAALVLGHGAGGGVGAPDLQAAARAAQRSGLAVALVEQPYRVLGRRAPAPALHLDAAWIEVIDALRDGPFAGRAIIAGGRSMGARVACRTAAATGAIGVVCLAFPLVPPQRAGAAKPPVSRLEELDGVNVPVLVVQGERDPFGMPPDGPGRIVVRVSGDHSLKKDLPAVEAAVTGWLAALPASPVRS